MLGFEFSGLDMLSVFLRIKFSKFQSFKMLGLDLDLVLGFLVFRIFGFHNFGP